MTSFSTDALSGLCTREQLDLLNSIDTLRLQGISHYVSLPQIIVCGDQSSGKSSVLEAISGVAFPVKSNLCTRFPTELVLRKSAQVGVSVSIVPHPSRSESERHSLSTFRETLDSFEGLPSLIDKAKEVMGISMQKAFSNDLLRVEIAGPDRPHLTIVDLPGLIHSATKQQSAEDISLVQDVVQAYMSQPRSIILAVVSAKNDFANQIVLRLARIADKSGRRTMGVITKPDALVSGSDSEKMFVSLAKNQEVEFRLGWHVLKNMDTEKGRGTLSERNTQEAEFFSKGVWEFMPRNLLGIDAIRVRLSKLLLLQIASELPSLIDEIKVQVDESQEQLKRLGDARETLQQQQAYLYQISQSFQVIIKAAVDGTHNSEFFDDVRANSAYQKRLRAVVQNLNEDFAELMRQRGHRRQICERGAEKTMTDQHGSKIVLTREDYIKHIEVILRRSRGRELPGTFNPMVISELFMDQCAPWKAITRDHVAQVVAAVKVFIELTITHIADTTTVTALMRDVFGPKLDELRQTVQNKTTELLVPHIKGHPITYNHYFTENLQKIRHKRREREVLQTLQTHFNISNLDEELDTDSPVNLRGLFDSIMQSTEPDMGRFASAEALDCMLAYYKVALKRFIDDIAIEAIETKLIASLSKLFDPVTVFGMAPETVTRIAGETEEYRSMREHLNKKLDILNRGVETCKKFVGIRGIATEITETDLADSSSSNPPDDPYSSPAEVDISTPEKLPSGEDQESSPVLVPEPVEGASGYGFTTVPEHQNIASPDSEGTESLEKLRQKNLYELLGSSEEDTNSWGLKNRGQGDMSPFMWTLRQSRNNRKKGKGNALEQS